MANFESVFSEYEGLVGKTFTGFYKDIKSFYVAERHKVVVDPGEIEEVLQNIVDSDADDRVWKGLYRSSPDGGQFVIWAYEISTKGPEYSGKLELGKKYEFEVTGYEDFPITERGDKYDGGVSVYLRVIDKL